MKYLKLILLMLCITSTCVAQQDNPRGIFRLTSMTLKNGTTVKALIDQYKFCGDSACVMLTYNQRISEKGNIDGFIMVNNDLKAFNYTGDKSNDEVGLWIYDSYPTHFALKWYSKVMNHPYFPNGGWVTEWYDSTVGMSDFGKNVLEAFKPHKNKEKIEGVWTLLGSKPAIYMIVNEDKLIMYTGQDNDYQRQVMRLTGVMMDFSYDGKRYMKNGFSNYIVEWQGDDMIQVSSKDDTTKPMQIWQRSELPPAYKTFFSTLKYE